MKKKYRILVLVSVIILFVLEAQAQYTFFDHDGIDSTVYLL